LVGWVDSLFLPPCPPRRCALSKANLQVFNPTESHLPTRHRIERMLFRHAIPLSPLVIGRPILKSFFDPPRPCIGESSVRLVGWVGSWHATHNSDREDATPTTRSDREDATPTTRSDREEADFHREDALPTTTSDDERRLTSIERMQRPLSPLVIGRPILKKSFFDPPRPCIGESSVRLAVLHAETILPIERMQSIIETFFDPTRTVFSDRES